MRIAIEVQTGGYTIKQIIVTWLKCEGDAVKAGEILATIDTDKVLVDLESPCTGKLVEIVPGNVPRAPDDKEGEYLFEIPKDLKTGNWNPILGYIEDGVADVETVQASVPVAKNESPVQEPQNPEPVSAPHPKQEEPYIPPQVTAEKISPSSDFIKAGPRVRRLAKEKGVDLSFVPPTGPHGTVSEADLNKYLANADKSPVQKPESPLAEQTKTKETKVLLETEEFIIEPLSAARKAIAKHMEDAKCTVDVQHAVLINLKQVVHAKVFAKWNGLYDAIPPEEARKYLRPEIIVIEGMIRALQKEKNKIINSCYGCEHFGFEGRKYYKNVNLGVAYGLKPDLKVPVLHKMQNASFREIAERVDDLYARMAKGRWKIEEVSGGTLTFNNVGALGGIFGMSKVTHGQSAICVLHGIRKKDVCLRDYGKAYLSLSFDHREFDGLEAAGFLEDIKEFVEGIDFIKYVISAHKS